MIDVVSASEQCGAYRLRAWTGVATDEGVGLLALVEVSGARGAVVCRFEEFLAAAQQQAPRWSRDDKEAALRLQEQALRRAREGVLGGTLAALHGHRFDADGMRF